MIVNPDSRLNFLQKLHYTVLKEIHFQNFVVDRINVTDPDTYEIVQGLEAKGKLRKLQHQERRLRFRIHKLKQREL